MLHYLKCRLPTIGICAIGIAWIVIGRIFPSASLPASAALEVDARSLDIGDVDVRPDFVHRVLVRNRSSSPVEVTGFETSCRCTLVKPERFPLDRGEQREIEIHLNLEVPLGSSPGQMSYPFRVMIKPSVNNHPISENWAVHGTVFRDFSTLEPDVWIGSRSPGVDLKPRRTIRVTSRYPLASAKVECDPPWVSAEIHNVADSQREWDVTMISDRRLPSVGTLTGSIKVIGTRLDGTIVTSQVARYSTAMTHDVQASPQTAVIWQQPGAAAASEVVTLKSRSGEKFDVVGFVVNPANAIDVQPLDAGRFGDRAAFGLNLKTTCRDNCNYNVVFQISQTGQDATYSVPVAVSAFRATFSSARKDN